MKPVPIIRSYQPYKKTDKELPSPKISITFFRNTINRFLNTVILSNFLGTRTVLHSISSYQTQTAPKYFYDKTRVRGVDSNHHTTIKNLELFFKN